MLVLAPRLERDRRLPFLMMNEPSEKRVFVSYVSEDSDPVDRLCGVLEAATIPYWRDRTALAPGDAWKAKIRQAIRDGSLVFLACFSKASRARERSYMNEELTLAVDEYRKMPPGRTWLIPVRFDPGPVPDWDLGAGRALSDLNYADLFDDAYTAEAVKLISVIQQVLGNKRMSPAAALAAVEEATDVGRVDLLKRLTKDMLLEPTRRIELDDLVSQEVQRVAAVLNDPEGASGPLGQSDNEVVLGAARRAADLWSTCGPFCASLQVAARYGTPDLLGPWVAGLETFMAAALRPKSGETVLLAQRHLPGVVGIATAVLASLTARRWDNLRTLVVDPTVRDRYDAAPLSLCEATDPSRPFGETDLVSSTLARASIDKIDYAEALSIYQNKTRYRSPASEWLRFVTRPLFADQLVDDDGFDVAFDRMQVVLGALAQDQANQRGRASYDGTVFPLAYWLSRAAWRAAQDRVINPVKQLSDELATQGARWAPLRADLFGADKDRACQALEALSAQFDAAVRQAMFAF